MFRRLKQKGNMECNEAVFSPMFSILFLLHFKIYLCSSNLMVLNFYPLNSTAFCLLLEYFRTCLTNVFKNVNNVN